MISLKDEFKIVCLKDKIGETLIKRRTYKRFIKNHREETDEGNFYN